MVRTDGGFRAGKSGTSSSSAAAYGVCLELGIPKKKGFQRTLLARLGQKVEVHDSFTAESLGMLAGLQALRLLLRNCAVRAMHVARTPDLG